MEKFPKSVSKVRARKMADGSFMLPRCNRKDAEELNKNFIRCGGEFRWFEKPEQLITLETLRTIFEGRRCYIVGKGPSLDNIKASDIELPNSPVVCINESIHKIEALGLPNPIFAIQQDIGLKTTCMPSKGIILISTQAVASYEDFDRKYIYNPRSYKMTPGALTVEIAVAICKELGTTSFLMVCFDAHENGSTDYAKVIGHPSSKGGSMNRFKKHAKILDKILTVGEVEYITPTVHQIEASSYTPEQPQQHQTGHHEHHDAEHSEDLQDMTDSS